MIEYTVDPIENDEEDEALGAVLLQCFNAPAAVWPEYRDRLGPENFRVLRGDGRLAGGLAVIPMAQWFGGKSVPMVGIAAVGIAPEARGTGAASALMRAVLSEIREQGHPLSGLFSAAQPLYRSLGYEAAGNACLYELSARTVGIKDREMEVREVDLDSWDILVPLDRKRARASSGNLDRSDVIWRDLVKSREGPVHGYVVGPEGAPEGYVLFRHVAAKDDRSADYDLQVRDLVALTPAAHRRLWTLLADHRSQAGAIRWIGPAAEPCLLIHPDHHHRVLGNERWFLRVINASGAFSGRGYNPDTTEELHLDIGDDLFPENAGRHVLTVEDGAGRLEPGGRGDLRLDVRALAPLYSGYLSTATLASVGLLEGPPEALVVADHVFAGPEPWMPDDF